MPTSQQDFYELKALVTQMIVYMARRDRDLVPFLKATFGEEGLPGKVLIDVIGVGG